MRKLICLIVLAGMPWISYAALFQDNSSVIKGKITDTNGSPLAGAGITVEKTLLGSHSDQEGNFSLSVRKGGVYVLHFSFIGYESKICQFRLSRDTVLNIVLSTKTVMTEAVFVNATRAGYETPMTYTTVTREEISKINTAQDVPYLLGYTPSLVVSSDAGTGVGYTYINIRGTDVKRINVTIDGIPVNDAESHGVWWVDLPDQMELERLGQQ
jgi:iron complex outermembrane receptor protein